ncbi:hypothetical protein HPB50_016449 [Hyalomma asiaticum]|uniref:Uncharacterized protein n=1 Tax=Hyalomma asiaticum TaxID=266040 RepID=A0ACB7SR37_HYAAI|nr:hypothetical protein HPB50_016449 [Hyalomma asiaticum]
MGAKVLLVAASPQTRSYNVATEEMGGWYKGRRGHPHSSLREASQVRPFQFILAFFRFRRQQRLRRFSAAPSCARRARAPRGRPSVAPVLASPTAATTLAPESRFLANAPFPLPFPVHS